MSELLLEAGCKKKQWVYNKDGVDGGFNWIPDGVLLQDGVCISSNYRKYIAPEQEKTIVNSTIEYQTVRNVDAKEQTLSFDLVLTLEWLDPNIRTSFDKRQEDSNGTILFPDAVNMIWTPDLYVWNRKKVMNTNGWISLIKSRILPSNTITEEEAETSMIKQPLKTRVEMKYEIQTTVYCKFQYSKYPMDSQNCSVKLGSSSNGAIFTLFDHSHNHHRTQRYYSVGLIIEVMFFGKGNKEGNDAIGFHVQMTRLKQPYLMMYYVPCIAIVLVSELGFLVPLTADGSSSLLVTNLLTLVSLFIYQMVRILKSVNCYLCRMLKFYRHDYCPVLNCYAFYNSPKVLLQRT